MNEYFVPETIWPCWAYALKRVGKSDLLTAHWVHEEMPKLLSPYHSHGQIFTGDILVWRMHDAVTDFHPVGLTDGPPSSVLHSRCKYDYHAAVCEQLQDGGYIVSDMVPGVDESPVPFMIRFRKLSELSCPDFVLSFKEQNEYTTGESCAQSLLQELAQTPIREN